MIGSSSFLFGSRLRRHRATKAQKGNFRKRLERKGGETWGREKKGKGNEGAAKFRAMEEEIWAEVKKGEMSKEDAMEKLGQLKEEMFGGKGK